MSEVVAKPGDLVVLRADADGLKVVQAMLQEIRGDVPPEVAVLAVGKNVEIQQLAVQPGDLLVFSGVNLTGYVMRRTEELVRDRFGEDVHVMFRHTKRSPELDLFTAEELERAGLVRQGCPDGGKCHHACAGPCRRVWSCGPLSGVYPDDRWPEDVVRKHRAPGAHQPSDEG